jgi:hypothetical protein
METYKIRADENKGKWAPPQIPTHMHQYEQQMFSVLGVVCKAGNRNSALS